MAAVVQTNSTLLSQIYGTTPGPLVADYVGDYLDRGKEGTVAVTTNDSVNSQYRFCRVNSADSIKQLYLGSDALGGTAAVKIGLYEVNSTTVAESTSANAALFVSSVTLTTALTPTDERFNTLAGNTIGQRVWELLGLSADPGKDYDLCATLTVVAASNGKLSFRVTYTR